jgi:tetratricopeptide (TPR) repeat protein
VNVVSMDDLKFAYVRARYLDSPQQVAAGLLAAADRPELLDGVSALQARVTAGGVLADFGDRDEAIGILRSAVAQSEPGWDEDARLFLAVALAEAGEIAEAEAIARQSIDAEAGGLESPNTCTQYMFMAKGFAMAGLRELATRWADEGLAAASAVRGSRSVRFRAGQMAATMREGIDAQLLRLEESGLSRSRTANLTDPPWPGVTDGRLLWWPQYPYGRLIRQAPVLGEFLGRSWPDHARLVESALRESVCSPPTGAIRSAGQTVELVAADFDNFTSFLQRQGADPRDRATLTAYAAQEAATPVVTWPPKPRKRCWCWSGRRYQDCCGAGALPTA